MTLLSFFYFAIAVARPMRLLGQALAEHALDIALSWHRRLEMRRTRTALDALDEHMLRDLGVSRSEVSSVAAEHAGLAERTRINVVPATVSKVNVRDVVEA
jgi:uncharacterized protein YjiS (DUF1127 family)